MSNHQLPANHKNKAGHGTVTSYVVGFMLSLLFTFIPYQLVVNQSISGTPLLVTILGFAVLQMVVQIVFFLHLGRGPKPFYNIVFFVSTVGIILIVVGGSLVIINNLHYNKKPVDQIKSLVDGEGIYQINGQQTGACQGQHTNHQIKVKNGQPTPLQTIADKCDTLSFINEDGLAMELAFGPHESHASYAGESELSVSRGKTETITLSETGTYQFHDHLQQKTFGTFTVTEQ